MKIFINGDTINLTTANTSYVSDALALYIKKEQQGLTYAVALNSTFVSKQNYDETPLNENDSLDVLFPIVGG